MRLKKAKLNGQDIDLSKLSSKAQAAIAAFSIQASMIATVFVLQFFSVNYIPSCPVAT